ncbi:Eco57I restriction-modification methylase domain-containing protein [Thioalkalivibrio sp. HK1]|uniref:Eco57I restriction-modification methylase domain-containing protein n=1 Tax=Thioalkalivibrio sp. HK1 TaxID=1469245 RepID=UPI0018CC73FB|nr:N-6 DNA methylase [Thioalkalivibrio sp. HK1]
MDRLKNATERNRLGQFATPPELARNMIGYVKDLWKSRSDVIDFLDPAIGTGAFFSALKHDIPRSLIRRSAGFEIDKVFAETGQRLWQREGLQITPGDFIDQPSPEKHRRFNLILTNPPYVRHHHLKSEQKERCKAAVERELGLKISGLAGLYCYFLLLADRWLADDGIGIWLIPSEFMTVNYGEAVKRYLLEHVHLLHIHRFCPSDVQFSDALVSSAIVVFQKNASRPATVRFSFGGSITRPDTVQQVPYDKLVVTRRWTQFPGADRTREEKWKLGDLFSIKRGIVTGANRFFILPRAKARLLGIPHRFQKPILPSPRYLSKTVVASDQDGYPVIDCPLSLIDCPLPEEEVQQAFPRFWEYLETGKRQRVHELYLPSRRSPWYSQEQRLPAPFLCTYMGRTGKSSPPFRFLWNQSQAITANVYLLLYPKSPLQQALQNNDECMGKVFSLLQSIRTESFLDESRVYGGGLYQLEPKELARLPADFLLSAIEGIDIARQQYLFEGCRM